MPMTHTSLVPVLTKLGAPRFGWRDNFSQVGEGLQVISENLAKLQLSTGQIVKNPPFPLCRSQDSETQFHSFARYLHNLIGLR